MGRNPSAQPRQDGLTPGPIRRPRRPPAVTRRLLLDAARDEFCNLGYAKATTKDIALRAGVSERMLFHHFGTKAALFDEAIFEPLADFVARFVAGWSRESYDAISDEYLGGLYRLLREHREIVMVLLTANRYDSVANGTDPPDSPLSIILDQIHQFARSQTVLELDPALDYAVASRAVFAMCFGMAVLDEWLFPRGSHPSEGQILQVMSALVKRGGATHGNM